MKIGNIVLTIAIGGFLHLGGYIALAKIIWGIATISIIVTGIKRSIEKKSGPSPDSNPNTMDPIEIETTRKPDYQIPSEIVMGVSPDEDPSTPTYAKAAQGFTSPLQKYIKKKMND